MRDEPDDDSPDTSGRYETEDDDVDQCPMDGYQ